MQGSDDKPSKAVRAAAKAIQSLAAGELAELRRMKEGQGAPAFWRLAARHPGTIGCSDREADWTNIVRILAILTPKGDPERRAPLHNETRHLGEVLCDGGDSSWPSAGRGKPRPVFGEHRLAQLIAARGPQRAKLLERAIRFIESGSQVNVVDIANTLLKPDGARRLAEPYYRRLDRAEWTAGQSKEGSD